MISMRPHHGILLLHVSTEVGFGGVGQIARDKAGCL